MKMLNLDVLVANLLIRGINELTICEMFRGEDAEVLAVAFEKAFDMVDRHVGLVK